MTEAERLNAILDRDAPAVARLLSPLGRAAAFPKGIPYQASQARGTAINATIGQMTDGAGRATPLAVLEDIVPGLDTDMTFLYAPVDGNVAVRELWRAREQRLGESDIPVSLPAATHGLTHGLSLIAALFADPDATVVVPTPFWGNYRLIFQLHAHAKIATYPFFDENGFNLDGLSDCLDQIDGKAIVMLNLPGNPTGYALSPDEARRLCELVRNHKKPAVFVVDDAYQGFIFDESRHQRSEFWDLADAIDPEHHVLFKVDGATKELLFFGSRLGFLTHPHVQGEAEEALASKLKYVIRGTVGAPPGPSQALVHHALTSPTLEQDFAARLDIMKRRFDALKSAVDALDSDRLIPYPFNAAFFMLFRLEGMSSEEARLALLDRGVGTIAFSEPNALRVAFCSVREEDLPKMVQEIAAVVG